MATNTNTYTQPGGSVIPLNAQVRGNAASFYNSLFQGGGGNPNTVYNKPNSTASSLASGGGTMEGTKPLLRDPNQQYDSRYTQELQQQQINQSPYSGGLSGMIGDLQANQQAVSGQGFRELYQNQRNQNGGNIGDLYNQQRSNLSPFSFGSGMFPGTMGVNYSGQNPNLGRYVPPMMYGRADQADPSNWMNSGGYAYNSPNSYGDAGVFSYPPMWY